MDRKSLILLYDTQTKKVRTTRLVSPGLYLLGHFKNWDFIRIAYPSSLLNNQCTRISVIQTNNSRFHRVHKPNTISGTEYTFSHKVAEFPSKRPAFCFLIRQHLPNHFFEPRISFRYHFQRNIILEWVVLEISMDSSI
jgi:hypothetical protein